MSPEQPGNIRVFVQWREQTVFAGEEVQCTITFKNVAPDSYQQQKRSNQQQKSQGERQRLTVPFQTRARGSVALTSPPSTTTTRGHRRSALSLSVSTAQSHSRSGSLQWPQSAGINRDWRSGDGHKKSLSIVSIGSANTIEDHAQRSEGASRSHRPRTGHSRAASLQIPSPGVTSPGSGPQSAPFLARHISSPLLHASYPPDRFGRYPDSSTMPNTPGLSDQRRSPTAAARQRMPDFRFPLVSPPKKDEISGIPSKSEGGSLGHEHNGNLDKNYPPMWTKEQAPSAIDRPAARLLASNTIPGGTPRSSGEFYAMSNNSTETLASEYVNKSRAGPSGRPLHSRRSSGMPSQSKASDSLMMGYAQIQGSFALDGSLVSLAPFEEVKKKGAVGGRGGGVIGVESTKKETGLLRGLGWGSISNSIGDLLGGGDMSTIKDMRGAANSKAIPLLSTPQSILFVDLNLASGESRSFEYSFNLPKGLPPTYKGKTIKISYSLVIGTQRAGGVKEQQVRSVDIPFRVLGSVNGYGEILGHDLMNPHILLRDTAEVKSLGKHQRTHQSRPSFGPPATMNEFLEYVNDLETRPRGPSGLALMSPTEGSSARNGSGTEGASTAKDAIHLAILRSNVAVEGQQSANRFEIARNGQRVGVLMLTRPAYRLGEVITMAIDFANSDISCYAVHATLETSEKVDGSLAVRSESSLQRVTRKIYVASSEAAMFSRRVVFTPTIPITATPEFITSGINLEWKIRVEFVVPYQGSEGSRDEQHTIPHPLMEQISQNEKGGLVLAGMENLACESFDVHVPLRVYGAVGQGLEKLERDQASEEGLMV